MLQAVFSLWQISYTRWQSAMKVVLGLASVLVLVCAASATQLPEKCRPPGSLRETLEKDPSAEPWTDTGAWFEQHGNLRRAVAWFQQAAQLDPRSAHAHYNLGTAQVRAEQLAAAAAEFPLALNYEPGLTEAALERVALARARGAAPHSDPEKAN